MKWACTIHVLLLANKELAKRREEQKKNNHYCRDLHLQKGYFTSTVVITVIAMSL